MSTDQQAPKTGKAPDDVKEKPKVRAEQPNAKDQAGKEPTGAPATDKDSPAGHGAGQDKPEDTKSRGPEFGSDRLSEELLDESDRNATESLAFDEAMQGLGFQTNQQINNFFRPDGTRAAVTRERLTISTLARIRETFVQPGGYRELWRRLEQRSLVILCARPGFGRQHAAIHLLDAQCDGRVEKLSGKAIGDLAEGDLSAHTGYLWTELRDRDDVRAQVHQIERLAELLQHRGIGPHLAPSRPPVSRGAVRRGCVVR